MNKLGIILRILEGIANAINRKKKRDAADNPATAIANGDRVRKSSKTYSDLADESERNGAE